MTCSFWTGWTPGWLSGSLFWIAQHSKLRGAPAIAARASGLRGCLKEALPRTKSCSWVISWVWSCEVGGMRLNLKSALTFTIVCCSTAELETAVEASANRLSRPKVGKSKPSATGCRRSSGKASRWARGGSFWFWRLCGLNMTWGTVIVASAQMCTPLCSETSRWGIWWKE